MDQLAIAVTIAVPALSGLVTCAFAFPEFYVRHLSSAVLVAPFLVTIARLLWLWGYSTAAAEFSPPGQTAILSSVTELLATPAIGVAVWIALRYLAHISPKRKPQRRI